MLLYFQEGGGNVGVGSHHTSNLSHQFYPTTSLMRQGSGLLSASNRDGMKLPFFNLHHDRRTPEQLAGKRTTEMNIPPLPVPWPPYATTGGAGGGGGSAYSNSSMSGSGLLQSGVHPNNGGCGTTTALGTPLHCPSSSGVLGVPTPVGGGGSIGAGPGASSAGCIAAGAGGGGGTSSSFDQHLDALGYGDTACRPLL